jgi:polyhydroxyalkanoate synthesis regulator protein
MNAKTQSDPAPVIIKKYANRRLYNTATSSYVTLDNLSQMVRAGRRLSSSTTPRTATISRARS